VTEIGAQACPREQCPQTAGRAVKAIGQAAADAIGRLLGNRRALKRLIGLGKGCRTGLCGRALMLEHMAMDNCRQIDLVGKIRAVFFIGQEIDG
jgi:hypothetical protein